jgi:iron complex outermembrane receptor protein
LNTNKKLSYAILAILGAYARATVATEGEKPIVSSTELEDIVVTATRRSVSAQDVPIAITAMSAETLMQLNVQTFDDYVRYLPNVSSAGKGPGQNAVYMRGLSSTTVGNQVGGGVGSFPNVAIYLDDLSGQLPGRNLDVYAADLDRIEVLEGPQGTLFGAGAQAGVVRYITNKPKLDVTEGGFSGSYSTTAHGDPSNSLEAFINLPLIADTLAVRGVLYSDNRGGYIHNIPGTFSRSPTDLGIAAYFAGVVPPGPSINNSGLVNSAYNPVVYKGTRVEALYKLNDDWNLLLSQSYQSLNADGVFDQAQGLGDLNVQQYNQSRDVDKFSATAWTLNGRLGLLNAVYTGGYISRTVDQVTDYTAYARGLFASYYQCDGPTLAAYNGGYATKLATDQCGSPSAYWRDIVKETHWSHEIRISSPDDWRARFIAGAFYEDFKVQDSANWAFALPTIGGVTEFSPFGPIPGTTASDPSVRAPGVGFFDDITRGYRQKALFGEFAFDLIPKQLTLTVGERFYDMPTYEKGSKNTIYGCRYQIAANGCTNYGVTYPGTPYSNNLDAQNLSTSFSGHTGKVNLSWKALDGVLLYATYSEGFRPGGYNRGESLVPTTSPLHGVFQIPVSYKTDSLKNYEIGWKTTLFDRRLQFDGAAYEEKWSNVQLSVFNTAIYGDLTFTANGPDYEVKGLETSVSFRATEGLTLMGSAAWNHSEQMTAPQLQGTTGQTYALFPTAGLGSPLAQAPPLQFNLRARYEWSLGDYRAWAQGAGQHSAHSFASVVTPINYEQSPYTTYDASLGVGKGRWTAEFFGQNLTDTVAQLYKNSNDFVLLTTVNRPRVLGIRVSYKMSDAGR